MGAEDRAGWLAEVAHVWSEGHVGQSVPPSLGNASSVRVLGPLMIMRAPAVRADDRGAQLSTAPHHVGGLIHKSLFASRLAGRHVIVDATSAPRPQGIGTGEVTGSRASSGEGVHNGWSGGFRVMNRRRDMRRNTFGAVCGVAACVVALAGCTSDDIPPSASPSSTGGSSTRTAATIATPTPTRSLTPEQQDLRSAEEAITQYWKVIDEAASIPNQDLKVLSTVARSQALAQWQNTLTTDRASGLRQQGLSTVRDARASSDDGKTYTVSACLDVSAVDVVDASGKSVVRSDRPATRSYTYTVQKAPQGFFVIEDLLKGQSCSG